MAAFPYPVVVFAGMTPPQLDGVRLVHLAPTSWQPEAVLDALRSSGLTPSDLRSKMLFLTDLDPYDACVAYTAVVGFAGRRIDAGGDGAVVKAVGLDRRARELDDAGRPAATLLVAQFGVPHPDMMSVTGVGTPDEVSVIRYAKRLRFAPVGDTLSAVSQLIAVGGVRAKGTLDRLPFLVTGDEPVGDDPTATVGICLDTLKRDAAALRRAARADDRSAVADTVEVTDRQKRLAAAAAAPIVPVLAQLGVAPASSDDPSDVTLWHCPRPDNHAHGDANASFTVTGAGVACPRCDVEPLDSLRLVMTVRACSPDEAADFLGV